MGSPTNSCAGSRAGSAEPACHSFPITRMTLETPVWQAFDPATDDVPDSILALLDGGGPVRVLALAVAPTAEDGPWAAGVSAQIAEAAAARGARTLLIDLGLEGSSLPAELDITPGEGISDVFEFGASARRVSTGVREGSFLFVPAGTVVGDSSKILEHPRWGAVLAGYRSSGTLVLLHVPLSLEGAAGLLERADAVVVLAGAAAASEALLESSTEVHAVIGPPEAAEGIAAGAVEDPGAEGEDGVAGGDVAADDVASLEVRLAESLELAEEPGALGLTSQLEAGTRPVVDEGAAWAAERPAEDLPTGEDAAPGEGAEVGPDPFWDEAAAGDLVGERAEPAGADEPDATGDPDTLLYTEFEGLPGIESPSGSRRSRLLLLALIVIVVVALIALMSWGDEPAVSSGPADDEAPIEVSAARSAEADMVAARPEPGDESEGGDPVTVEGSVSAATGGEPVDPTVGEEGGAPAELVDDATEGGTPPATSPGRLSPNAVMRFGLTINAHERRTAAEEQAQDLRARFPSLQFVLVPVQVRSVTYYRVVAGPAETGARAEAIRAELAGYIGSAVARSAIVRSTRVAFLLGEYESLDEAMARRAQAEDAGIPAYFAEYGLSAGPLRYRVYSGAYANAREASHLQTQLIETGLTGAILTERMGRPLR